MLIDKKFIYIALPRCASSSFHWSCLKNGIGVENGESEWNTLNADIDISKVENDRLMDVIMHGHEELHKLKKKFGNGYDVISVKRNRHERFISLFKHTIHEFFRIGEIDIYNKLINLTLEEILFFNSVDIISKSKRFKMISQFLQRLDLPVDHFYGLNIFDILYTPTSYWHVHDSDIIWFDFEKLDEMEEWVSNKINKPFKLERTNGSQHFKCNLELNNDFIKLYDSIYDYYDFPKSIKTLI
jgi:hypothetical protein